MGWIEPIQNLQHRGYRGTEEHRGSVALYGFFDGQRAPVAGAVAGVAAVAAEAERNFFGDAPELCGDERSVGGDDDDDRSDIFFEHSVLGDFAAYVDAGDAELIARSVVALHEDADTVASG